MLDSSIMPLGSKIKVVMAISQKVELRVKSSPLHKVISVRNAFAHHGTSSHPTLYAGKGLQDDGMEYHFQIITQSGKVERKTREEALEEFNTAFLEAKNQLIEIRDKVSDDCVKSP